MSIARRAVEPLLTWPTDDASFLTRTEIWWWWEARQFRFNLYVGAVGLLTWVLVLVAGSAAVKPGTDFEEPIAMLLGPFLYGIAANVCYSFGWIVDVLLFRGTPRIKLYKTGVVFSLALTALPGIWGALAWLFTIVSGHKLD
jgi:hypothetical protein